MCLHASLATSSGRYARKRNVCFIWIFSVEFLYSEFQLVALLKIKSVPDFFWDRNNTPLSHFRVTLHLTHTDSIGIQHYNTVVFNPGVKPRGSRLDRLYTVDEQVFFLLILRYPACFTVNVSFLSGDFGSNGVAYESFDHVEADLDGDEREQLCADCQYSQRAAAEYLRENADCVRAVAPDPDTDPFERRGGFVHITGRQGSTFNEVLAPVSPDPDRFDEKPSTPELVPEGPEAKRARRKFLTDVEVLI